MLWPTAPGSQFCDPQFNLERSHRRHHFAYYRSIEVDLSRISAFVDDDKALVRIIPAGLTFAKAKPDLRREEDPRFGDFSRCSC